MKSRQLKARQIVAAGEITVGPGYYRVGAQSGPGCYRVTLEGLYPNCTCPDWETTGADCKHMLAVREWLLIQAGDSVIPSRRAAANPVPRPTYKQDWKTYNLAQTTEKAWFMSLLADLCTGIPEPERKPSRGRPPVAVGDAMFAACFKVYSGFSARRFATDLSEAAERGHVGKAIHFNSVLNALESEAAAPVLTELIARSASPLRAVETEFAVDSSGFSGSRFDRWYDEKYGVGRAEASWVKAHIICGTRTNIVAAAEVLDKASGDSSQLPKLVNAAAQGFKIAEVAGDKAYAGVANFDAVDKVGGSLYAAFKNNHTGSAGGLFGKAFHFFSLHREEYLAHYHRRSMVETTFSMVRRKFGDSVKAKSERAMRNEVLAELVCHNICCVITAMYERGIDPAFFGVGEAPDDGPRDVLRVTAGGPAAHKIRGLHN